MLKTQVARRKIIPYSPELKERARQLRNNSTLAEVLLWNQIKNKQMKGYQFLRQKPIDDYIVDFFCHEPMLAIEIDGDSHNYKVEEDPIRQKRLESLGIKFIRFMDYLDNVKLKTPLGGPLAPKGRINKAQGNALGKIGPNPSSPEGAS